VLVTGCLIRLTLGLGLIGGLPSLRVRPQKTAIAKTPRSIQFPWGPSVFTGATDPYKLPAFANVTRDSCTATLTRVFGGRYGLPNSLACQFAPFPKSGNHPVGER
jgi:hypothetical protein